MKTVFSILLSLVVFSLYSSAMAARGGDGTGNGGDTQTEQDFASRCLEMRKFLSEQADLGYYDYVSKNDLEAMKRISIRYSSSPRLFLKRSEAEWNTPILQGEFDRHSSDPTTQGLVKEVDAINFPALSEIRIGITRWQAKDYLSKLALALHENLGLIGKDFDYSISGRFESAMRGQTALIGLRSPVPNPVEPLPSGANGLLSQVGIKVLGVSTIVSWEDYRTMTTGQNHTSDGSFLLLVGRRYLRFEFKKTDDRNAHVSMYFFADPLLKTDGFDINLSYELDGELMNILGQELYYFRGDLRAFDTLYGRPARSAVQGRFQRTDFYYSPESQTLLMTWFACRALDASSCNPFAFGVQSDAKASIGVSAVSATYRVAP